MIDAALQLHPHLAVVTGDLISGHSDPLDACIRQLARLKADAGVFACMGNHERYARAEDYTARQSARVGIRFLRGQAQTLRFGDATLNLAGLDFQSAARARPLSARRRAPHRPRRNQYSAPAQSRRLSHGGPAGV